MEFLSYVSYFLFHITAWVVLLIVLILSFYVLEFLLKDITHNSGKNIKKLLRYPKVENNNEHNNKKSKSDKVYPSNRFSQKVDESIDNQKEESGIIYLDKPTSFPTYQDEETLDVKQKID